MSSYGDRPRAITREVLDDAELTRVISVLKATRRWLDSMAADFRSDKRWAGEGVARELTLDGEAIETLFGIMLREQRERRIDAEEASKP